ESRSRAMRFPRRTGWRPRTSPILRPPQGLPISSRWHRLTRRVDARVKRPPALRVPAACPITPPMRRFPWNSGLAAVVIMLGAALSPCAAQSARAPYDTDMQRLAEILGALHYLRAICGSNEGQTWRNEMQALVDAESPGGDRRDRLIGSFNRGYRGFQQTYRT